VAFLTLIGARRSAAAMAWVACAAHVMIISAVRISYAAHYETIGLLPPVVATLVADTLIGFFGSALFWTPLIASALLFGVPILIVLAGNGVLSRIRKSPPS
jgi:hypothetical protein